MVTLLIVYHSQSGNTLKMAEAVLRGAREIEGVKAILKKRWKPEKKIFWNAMDWCWVRRNILDICPER